MTTDRTEPLDDSPVWRDRAVIALIYAPLLILAALVILL